MSLLEFMAAVLMREVNITIGRIAISVRFSLIISRLRRRDFVQTIIANDNGPGQTFILSDMQWHEKLLWLCADSFILTLFCGLCQVPQP